MRATTTRRFNFYTDEPYTPESLHKIGEFIADHFNIDLVEGVMPERGIFKSSTNIIITISYEQADNKNRKDKQGISDGGSGK